MAVAAAVVAAAAEAAAVAADNLSKKINLAQPTISQAAMHGRQIAADEGLKLLE